MHALSRDMIKLIYVCNLRSFCRYLSIYCGYDILIVLPPPIKVEKGGVHDVYHFVFPYFCCGECSCILHLQMAGQKQ